MNLILQRETFTEDSTTGTLYIEDSDKKWKTLEDVYREVKIKHETAIPYGRYEVIISYSNRFKKLLPLLLNVPNFEGIRIHAGNRKEDTSGCILIGKTGGEDFIGGSRKAMEEFYPILESSLKTERCFIDIVKADFTRNVIA